MVPVAIAHPAMDDSSKLQLADDAPARDDDDDWVEVEDDFSSAWESVLRKHSVILLGGRTIVLCRSEVRARGTAWKGGRPRIN
jgi:hypothetical protein